MKSIRELKTERTSEFLSYDACNSGDCGHARSWECVKHQYGAGWDACLEELSKSAGEFDYPSYVKWYNDYLADRDETPCETECAEWGFKQGEEIIASLRLRIAEIEGEK